MHFVSGAESRSPARHWDSETTKPDADADSSSRREIPTRQKGRLTQQVLLFDIIVTLPGRCYTRFCRETDTQEGFRGPGLSSCRIAAAHTTSAGGYSSGLAKFMAGMPSCARRPAEASFGCASSNRRGRLSPSGTCLAGSAPAPPSCHSLPFLYQPPSTDELKAGFELRCDVLFEVVLQLKLFIHEPLGEGVRTLRRAVQDVVAPNPLREFLRGSACTLMLLAQSKPPK